MNNKLFKETFNFIGNYSFIGLFFLSIFILWNKITLEYYYLVGFFLNALLNIVMKGIIQQPRPSQIETLEKKNLYNSVVNHNRENIFKDGIPFNLFGMPSGHAQIVCYSSVFIYFATNNIKIFYIYLFFSLITCFQRFIFNYHTIFQIVVGIITGTLFGFFIYSFAREKIKGPIVEKTHEETLFIFHGIL
jgi:membrane-associated phospholipid phosphatase